MAKHFLIFLFLVFLLISCEKNDLINYPTIINKLSPTSFSEARASYFQTNKYIHSSINQFGFCDLEDSDNTRTVDSPPLLNVLTQSEAIEIVNNFVSQNQIYTGIKNSLDLTFSSIDSSLACGDGSTYWCIKTLDQKMDSLDVLYSQIIFHVKNREVVICIGNWFPDIYIPNKYNISKDKAKAILLNRVVSHYTIGGERYEVVISASCLNQSSIRSVIFPITTEDKIELRVVWQINIPGPVFYIITVDVMTGEILSEYPTIFS